MAFWKDGFMEKMRNEWLRRVSKFQYYAGGTWYDAEIIEKKISGNTLYVTTELDTDTALTVTKARLLDNESEVAGETTESVKKSATEGIITLWEFPLYEIQ